MTEAMLAFVFSAVILGGGVVWLATVAVRAEATDPDRLVSELRLAQYAALLLAATATVYIGFALAHDEARASGLVIALVTGFFLVAAVVATWEPGRALTALALAWGAHALLNLAHAADLLPAAIVPAWYPAAGAIYDICIAGLCYLPVLRR